MAQNASREWLIAYDIADKRRLSRVHRFIRKHAVPVQYSLYWYQGSSVQIDRLLRDIESRIDARHDDVRAYPIPQHASVDCVGRTGLPEGASLLTLDGSAPQVLGLRLGYDDPVRTRSRRE
ncbi:MAG TPA: CRISPR-associated endonuclease Cas2 [Thauera aminoaromatica]|nr:CRISPR-associated endonuclease Cas2 [Thauera aminoaromatica]